MKTVSSFISLLLLLSTTQTAHAISPSWRYEVLTSPHFEMIYRDTQKDLAKRYLLAAEQARDLMMPIFKEGPDNTIIFLQDDTDLSNGAADFLPYPHITVYPVLPLTTDSIDDYGDWPLEMMVHEYTHILNMYPRHSFYVPLSWIFGTVMRPNAALPRWYLEGLAVDTESWLSDHGRLRASETLASARALVLDNKLEREDIARANQQNLGSWPYGNRPYLYGGWWWESVTKDKGLELIERWNQNFARRLPFLLNGPMLEATGKSAPEWMDFTKSRLAQRAQKDIDAIKATKPPEGKSVLGDGGEQEVFALSPSGNRLIYWISWINQTRHAGGTEARVKDRSQGQDFSEITGKLLFKSVGTSQVRWIDEDRVVFDQVDVRSTYATFRDLYLYDFRTKKIERLTHDARAQSPAPSPNGEDIVFIQNDGGRTRLALLNLSTKQIRTLVNANLTQRLSGPEFFTRDQIVFSVRQRDGSEKLTVYDLPNHKVSTWSEKLKDAQGLRRTSNGFLVTDAGPGIRNAYWIHDGQTDAVSNTLTDVESADYDAQRKELLISELTSSGHKVRAIPFSTQHPPQIAKVDIPPPPKSTVSSVPLKEESFQPLTYMLPQYWIPFVYQTERGLVFQGITDSSDPTGRNRYSLTGSYDTVTKKPSYGVAYENSSTPTDIGAAYSKYNYYLGASDFTLESQSAGLDFSPTWPFNNRFYHWTLGGLWIETKSSSAFRRMGPTFSWQYNGMGNPDRTWYGYTFGVEHQEFLKQPRYYAYGRSTVSLVQSAQLGGGHKLELATRASFAPRMPFATAVLDTNIGGNYAVNLVNSNFLLRGYPSGEFLGRKVLNANLEYSLPGFPIEKGYGTFPWYLQNLEWVFFADTMAIDGAAWDQELDGYVRRTLGEFASGAGSEFRLATTAGYQLPLNLTLGLYYGMEKRFGGGFSPFLTVSYGALGGLQNNKTP